MLSYSRGAHTASAATYNAVGATLKGAIDDMKRAADYFPRGEIEDRIYNQRDFDRSLVLEKRTELVAKKVTEFLRGTNRFDKTIVFCEDIDHAERMRQALVNENRELVTENHKYVMRITGDNEEGKAVQSVTTFWTFPYEFSAP